MFKILFVIMALVIFGTSINHSFAQEIGLATFQENAQVVIDKSISQNVTASITLQSTSNQEMQIPSELEKKIRENDRVIAIILTNEENCVLGVFVESCIMINLNRDFEYNNIIEIQDDAKSIGNMYIDEINEFFDTNAEFHSVFIHHRDEANVAMDTSGVVSGKGTVSVVYTMPQEATDSMYEKISAILIPRVIRDSGGFFESAIKLSKDDNSRMTFSIIPMDVVSLFQLKVGVDYPNASSINQINPLQYLQTEQLTRSDYFSGGFYPLNSLIQVVILSSEPTKISDVNGKIIPTQIIEGEKIPTDVTSNGWVFDPEEGERVQGKYLFGKKLTVTSNELLFAIGDETIQDTKNRQSEFDESIIVVAIIVIIGIGAALFYLKGYKR